MSTSTRVVSPTAFPSSNVSEYRALQQVLTQATATGCSAEHIVRDALVGGVVTAYHDRQCRCVNQVFLPSSKCMPLLSTLIAEGFFSPVVSTVRESGPHGRLTPRCEMGTTSLFAVIALLFPDCFLDGAVCSPPASPPRSPPADSLVVNSTGGREDEASAHSATERSAASTLTTTPQAAEVSVFADHLADPVTSPLDAMILSSQEESAVRRQHATTLSVSGTTSLRLISSPVPFLAGPVHVLTEDQAAVPEAVATSSVCVDLLALHQERVFVAVVLLASLNDVLHAFQLRQLQSARESHKSAETTHGGQSSGLSSRAETAVGDATVACILVYKIFLLSCLCATEMSYMPANAKAWENPLALSPYDTCLGVANNSVTGSGSSRLLRLYPRAVLSTLAREDKVLRGEDPAAALALPRDGVHVLYDTVLDRLADAYQSFPHRSHADLLSWLDARKSAALRVTRAQLTHTPTLTLVRPVDGTPVALFPVVSNAPARRAKLPSLPPQPGELFMYPSNTLRLLLLDSSTSPLATILSLATAVRLTDAQLRNEVEPFLRTQSFALLSSRDRRLLVQFTRSTPELSHVLERNPIVLARLLTWIRASAPTEAPASDDATATAALAKRIETYVLFETPFSVAVGQFLRELVTRNAVTLDTMERWLLHCTTCPIPTTSLKIISAIADFAAVHSHWQYTDQGSQAVSQLKKAKPREDVNAEAPVSC